MPRSTDETPVPPDELRYVGGGDFQAVGEEFLGYFKEAGLRPGDDVLDMGCGVGRIAVPLTGYLDRHSNYAGFDIEPRAIKWCSENVGPLHPGFKFAHANLYNKRYNPEATQKASEWRFPYNENQFKFVVATSLFTHLLPRDMEHYLMEATRVIGDSGTLFLTFYLYSDEILGRRGKWKPGLTFEHEVDGCLVNSKKVPEAVVAYDDAVVEDACKQVGLRIESIHRGQWSGLADGRTNQDIVIAVPR